MSASSQTTNETPSGQLEQAPNTAGLRELDAALARMMGLGPHTAIMWNPGGVGDGVIVWTNDLGWLGGRKTLRDLAPYLFPPAYSSKPAASAELLRWLWAQGHSVIVAASPVMGEVRVTVRKLRWDGRNAGTFEATTEVVIAGPDPVASQYEALARCALKALKGSG